MDAAQAGSWKMRAVQLAVVEQTQEEGNMKPEATLKPFARNYFRTIKSDPQFKRPHGASQIYEPGQLPLADGWPTGIAVTPGTMVLLELGGAPPSTSDIAAWVAKMTATLGYQCPTPIIKSVVLTGGDNSSSDADAEVATDWQRECESWVCMTGPNGPAPNVLIVWGPNTSNAFTTITNYVAALTPAQLTQMGLAPVILACSESWGQAETQWAVADLSDLHAARVAAPHPWHSAAGDNLADDSTNDPDTDAPACLPSVVSCGGTSRVPPSGPEQVWNNGNGEGTGGGFSKIFARPSYQPLNGQSPAKSGGFDGRMVPDLANVADPNTGVDTVLKGSWSPIGGTSIVAPSQAGFSAVVNGARLLAGRPMLNGPTMNAMIWVNLGCFFDITSGNNSGYNATVGPDPCTGAGRNLGTLFYALTGAASTPPPVTNPPPVVPPPPPPPPPPPVATGWTQAGAIAVVDAVFAALAQRNPAAIGLLDEVMGDVNQAIMQNLTVGVILTTNQMTTLLNRVFLVMEWQNRRFAGLLQQIGVAVISGIARTAPREIESHGVTLSQVGGWLQLIDSILSGFGLGGAAPLGTGDPLMFHYIIDQNK